MSNLPPFRALERVDWDAVMRAVKRAKLLREASPAVLKVYRNIEDDPEIRELLVDAFAAAKTKNVER